MCNIVTVEVVTVDLANNMINFSQTVPTNVITLLHDYGGGGGLFILVSHLGIPGALGTATLFTYPHSYLVGCLPPATLVPHSPPNNPPPSSLPYMPTPPPTILGLRLILLLGTTTAP